MNTYFNPQSPTFFQDLEAKLTSSPDMLQTHYLVSHRDGSFSFQKKGFWLCKVISVYILGISYDVGAHIERLARMSETKLTRLTSTEELLAVIKSTQKIFTFFSNKAPRSFQGYFLHNSFSSRYKIIERRCLENGARATKVSIFVFAVTHSLFKQALGYLNDKDASITVERYGKELLGAALNCHNDAAILSLLAQNVSLEGFHIDKSDYLDKAYTNKNDDAAFRLLEEGVHFTDAFFLLRGMHQSLPYTDLLQKAFEKKRYKACFSLIECGADIDKAGVDKKILLQEAIKEKTIYSIVRLINLNAPLPEKDFDPSEYLQACESYEQDDGVMALVKAGANIDLIKSKHFYLAYAIEAKNDQEIALRFLARDDIKINLQFSNDGQTFLHMACHHELVKVVDKLLEKGADVNIGSNKGEVPLHLASRKANALIAKKLLDAKTNLAIKNKKGVSPLLVPLFESPSTLEVQEFYDTLFFDYPNIQKRIREHGLDGFITYIESREALSAKKTAPQKVLMFAVLLQNEALAKQVAQEIPHDQFVQALDELQRYFLPQSCAVVKFATYSVVSTHYTKGISDLAIECPEKRVSLRLLLDHFDKLNFSDPKHPHFYDMKKVASDVADPTPSTLRSKLLEMLTKIEEKVEFLGTPKAKTEAIEEFYNTIQYALEHVLIKLDELHQKDVKNYPDHLLNVMDTLFRTMGHCGGRYYNQCTKLYQIVCKDVVLDFSDEVYETLRTLREIGMQAQIPQYDHNTNDYNHILQRLGLKYNLPGAKALQDFDDPYGSRLDFDKIERDFQESYSAENIFNECKEKLQAEGEFRNQFIDWCVQHMPKNWQKEHFESIQLEALAMKQKGKSREDIKEYLESKCVSLADGQTIENAVYEERKSAYLGTQVFNMETGKIKDAAILRMLCELEVLSSCYPDDEQSVLQRVIGGFKGMISRMFG